VAAEFSKREEDKRLIEFLMGLNAAYDNVRGNILMMNPLPSVNKAYNLLLQDEKQREIHSPGQIFPEIASMHVQAKYNESRKIICNHCKKPGHTAAKCYRLIGFPKDFKFTKSKHANACFHDTNHSLSSVDEMTSGTSLTSEQCQQLVQFLQHTKLNSGNTTAGNTEINEIRQANFAGIMACSSLSCHRNFTWIIDTGANEHMCFDKQLFDSLSLLSKPVKISIPNGQVITSTQSGSIHLLPNLVLNNVLYVPEFKHNLLSIARLCIDTKGLMFFSDRACFLQAPSLKRPLELGKLLNGLYLFQEVSALQSSSFACSNNSICNSAVVSSMTWHHRLGHLPLYKLKQLPGFPCTDSDQIALCDICPKARQHRLPFPHSKRESLHSFDLIHVDVWGPYNTATYNGYRYFLTIEMTIVGPLGYIFCQLKEMLSPFCNLLFKW
jgi:hypothetical protein